MDSNIYKEVSFPTPINTHFGGINYEETNIFTTNRTTFSTLSHVTVSSNSTAAGYKFSAVLHN